MACKCSQYYLPNMYLDPTYASSRRVKYESASAQGPILNPILSVTKHCVFYSVTDFAAMYMQAKQGGPDELRLYFAVYGAEGTTSVPAGYGGKFTFLFAPGNVIPNTKPLRANDSGSYYTIPPGGPFGQVDSNIAKTWINNWVNLWLPKLPVDPTNPNNSGPGAKYSDTRCVFYVNSDLDELVRELLCQGAGGINIYLVSYPAKDPTFANRLTTQMSLADANGNDLQNIDISCRRRHKLGGMDLDTGNPCPPATGCSS